MHYTKKNLIVALVAVLLLVSLVSILIFTKLRNRSVRQPNIVNSAVKKPENFSSDQATSSTQEILSPEQIYEAFRNAMLQGDVETALLYIKSEKRELYRSVYNNKESIDFYKAISDSSSLQKNERESTADKAVYYFYLNNDLSKPYYLVLIKNAEGKWEIDSI